MDNSNNVMVIAYYYPPMGLSGVQRTLKFTKYLPDFNWNPIVLTCNDNTYYAFDDKQLNELDLDRVKIYRTSEKKKNKSLKFPSWGLQKLARYVQSFFLIPDSKIFWKKRAVELGKKIIQENRIDVIFATAPPFTDFLIGFELAKENDIPLVMDYRDTWVDNQFHYFPTIFHKRKHISLEEEALKYASKICVISRKSKEILLKRYKFLNHNDIEIIPHGYDREDFKDKVKTKNPNKFTITHSGLFQDDRNPKNFFKAIRSLIDEDSVFAKDLEIKLIGLMRKEHVRQIKKYKLINNVIMTGYKNHDDTAQELIDSDILLIIQNDDIRTPGKLFEYFGVAKPILACLPQGEMRDLALSSSIALCSNPSDFLEIKSNIKTYYDLWKRGSLPKGIPAFYEKYERKYLTEKLKSVLLHSSKI